MKTHHQQPLIISEGYQTCEGCGELLVNGDAAYYRPTGLDRPGVKLGGYTHQSTPPSMTRELAGIIRDLSYHLDVDPNSMTCAQLASGYLQEKEATERATFPNSAADIYGDYRVSTT